MPPVYRIEWTATAKRGLAQLPERVATALVEFIYGPLAESPHRFGHELHLELAGHHSARRGTFRVIYIIDDDDRRVVITDVKHRGDAYRRH
ncbi:MAG TPA: type II toxin-antitoxin system RelE/ParE family toxin [Mycobacteriales bacterium]|nr:type II toxin-antitoxin system RelE/ParE family toxin [Mycobacteriales bacterium]